MKLIKKFLGLAVSALAAVLAYVIHAFTSDADANSNFVEKDNDDMVMGIRHYDD